jgi:hypothetical protein
MDHRIRSKQDEAFKGARNAKESNNRPGWVSTSIVVLSPPNGLKVLSGFDSFNHRKFMRLCEMESIVPPKKRVKRVKTSSHTLKCLPQNRFTDTPRTSESYCPTCNLHIRGVNHNTGSHHLAAERKLA